MNNQQSITIKGDDRQHVIVITPVNVTLPGGSYYATGKYMLKEGDVGVGAITFADDMQWEFEGTSDFDYAQLSAIANFILNFDKPLLDDSVDEKTENPTIPLLFAVPHQGKFVQVSVLMHYPTYDVDIDGAFVATLEQDHHSNWFVAKGELSDDLVQQIGKRIVDEIAG